jgi:hypothetical protein
VLLYLELLHVVLSKLIRADPAFSLKVSNIPHRLDVFDWHGRSKFVLLQEPWLRLKGVVLARANR